MKAGKRACGTRISSEVIAKENKTNFNYIENVHNSVLTLICGALKATTITVLQQLTKNLLVSLEIQKLVAISYIKCKPLP